MKKVKIGILACSDIAIRKVIPAISKAKKAELSFIASRRLSKAKSVAQNFNCEDYGTYNDLISKKDIDLVYISVPFPDKKNLTRKLLDNNKNIYLEKPGFLSYDDAVSVTELAKKKELRVFEGWMFRFHSQHEKLSNVIRDNMIGKKILFDGQFTYPKPQADNIRLKPNLYGGVLNDSVGYPIYAACMVMGFDIDSLYCLKKIDKTHKVDNFLNIIIQHSSGGVSSIKVGFGLFYQSTYSVCGEKGKVYLPRAYSINDNMSAKVCIETNKENKTITLKPEDQFLKMIESFSEEIIKDKKNYMLFEQESIRIHKILSFVKKSADSGRVLKFE